MTATPPSTATTIETFGGRDNQNGPWFLYNVRLQLASRGIATPDARAEYFSWCLDYDSPAEAWFQALTPAAQTNWDQLVPLFIQRWTPPPALEKSPTEKIRELKNYRLEPDDIRKKAPYMGGTQHAHVKWAMTALGLAQVCNLETHMEYVDEAIDNLPNAVRHSLD
jgi:hypothetical protein